MYPRMGLTRREQFLSLYLRQKVNPYKKLVFANIRLPFIKCTWDKQSVSELRNQFQKMSTIIYYSTQYSCWDQIWFLSKLNLNTNHHNKVLHFYVAAFHLYILFLFDITFIIHLKNGGQKIWFSNSFLYSVLLYFPLRC